MKRVAAKDTSALATMASGSVVQVMAGAPGS